MRNDDRLKKLPSMKPISVPFFLKKNLVSNFLMSYQSLNKPRQSSSNKLWLLRGSVQLSCRIACMGVVSVRVRFLEGERRLGGEHYIHPNEHFMLKKLLFLNKKNTFPSSSYLDLSVRIIT